MLASSITNGVQGSPNIHFGFWHGDGVNLPTGVVLTINLSWFSVLNSTITLLASFTLSRLWSILNALVFVTILDRSKASLDESQVTALLVNTKAPLDTLLSLKGIIQRRGLQPSTTRVALSSLFILATTTAAPFIISRFPSYSLGRISSQSCGFHPIKGRNSSTLLTVARNTRLANAAQIVVNQESYAPEPKDRNTRRVATPLPYSSYNYTRDCPKGVQCHPEYPFTFSSFYALGAEHFRIGLPLQFTLEVFETCYRPIDAIAPISNKNSPPIPLGFFYGQRNISNETQPYTYRVYDERRLSPGYSLWQAAALDKSELNSEWFPNNSIALGGDTTILFYDVGGVSMMDVSGDPIFATNSSSPEDEPDLDGYYASRFVSVPIVCDTKYSYCPGNSPSCSPASGVLDLLDWMEKVKVPGYRTLSLVFNYVLNLPPIFHASLGSESIVARNTTTADGKVQLFAYMAQTPFELYSLSTTGMGTVATSLQLAATGYWDLGYGFSEDSIPSMFCDNVLIETDKAVTIHVTHYIVLLSFSLFIIIISYVSVPISRLGKNWTFWWSYAHPWAFYSAGQLHRRVAVNKFGNVGRNDPSDEFPPLASGIPGLDFWEDSIDDFEFDKFKESSPESQTLLWRQK